MIFRNTLCIISLLSTCVILYGMKQNSNTVIYAIPGQNGRGSASSYIKKILNWDGDIVQVETPSRLPDLGQYFCQRHLTKALKNEVRDVILYATSQGTATVLNFLAHGQNSSKIKAVILEAALASGNSAINHTVTGPLMNMPWIKNIPGAYYFVPYLATAACWGYRPGGQQPIWSVDAVKSDIPFIIIHSKDDKQLPFYGACALYYRLSEKGNRNVYFLEKDGYGHVQILENSPHLQSTVRTILKKHLQPQLNEILYIDNELARYQPDIGQYKNCYTDLIKKEDRLWYLEYGAILAAALYFGSKV